MKKLIIIFSILIGTIAFSSTPDDLVEDLFKGLKSDDIEKAAEDFLSANSKSVHNDAVRLQFEKHFGDLIDVAGDFQSYELLKKKRIGKTVEGRVYLLNHKKKPVQMTIVFYRNGGTWAVKHMHLDLDFSEHVSEELRKESILSR